MTVTWSLHACDRSFFDLLVNVSCPQSLQSSTIDVPHIGMEVKVTGDIWEGVCVCDIQCVHACMCVQECKRCVRVVHVVPSSTWRAYCLYNKVQHKKCLRSDLVKTVIHCNHHSLGGKRRGKGRMGRGRKRVTQQPGWMDGDGWLTGMMVPMCGLSTCGEWCVSITVRKLRASIFMLEDDV